MGWTHKFYRRTTPVLAQVWVVWRKPPDNSVTVITELCIAAADDVAIFGELVL